MITLKIDRDEKTKSRALISDRGTAGAVLPEMHLGDQIDVRIELHQGGERAAIDPTATHQLAIGASSLPTGFFTVSYDGETTAEIKADSSIDVIESRINELATVIADGKVDVTGSLALLKITFRTTGAKEVFTLETNDLSPTGNSAVTSLDEDNVTQLSYISQELIEYITDFTPVEEEGDIVALDCTIDLNTVPAAISFGRENEVTRVFQFHETLAGSRSTLLKASVTLRAGVINPAALISQFLGHAGGLPDFYSHASRHATGGADPLTPADIGAATAAQGLLADTAVQPGDNVSDLTNDAGYLTAVAADAAYATAAQGALVESVLQTPTHETAQLHHLHRRLAEIAAGTGDNLRVLHCGDSLGNRTSKLLHKYFLEWVNADPLTTFSALDTISSLGASSGGFVGEGTLHQKSDYGLNWTGTYYELAAGQRVALNLIQGGSGPRARTALTDRVQIYLVSGPGFGSVSIEVSDVAAAGDDLDSVEWSSPGGSEVTMGPALTAGELIVDLDGPSGLVVVEITWQSLAQRVAKVTELGDGVARLMRPYWFADRAPAIGYYNMSEGSNNFGDILPAAATVMGDFLSAWRPDVMVFQADEGPTRWLVLESAIADALEASDLDYTPAIILVGEGPKSLESAQTAVEGQRTVQSEIALRQGWMAWSHLNVESAWEKLDAIGLGGDGTHLLNDFYAIGAKRIAELARITPGPYVSVPELGWGRSVSAARVEVRAWESAVTANSGTLTADSAAIAEMILTELHRRGLRSKIKYMLPLLGADLAAATVPLIDDYGVGAATVEGYTGADFSEASGLQKDPDGDHYLDLLIGYANSINGGDDSWHTGFRGLTAGAPWNLREDPADTVGWVPPSVTVPSIYALTTNNSIRFTGTGLYADGLWSIQRSVAAATLYHDGARRGNVIPAYEPGLFAATRTIRLGAFWAPSGPLTPTDATITFFAKGDLLTDQEVTVFYEIIRDCLLDPLGR